MRYSIYCKHGLNEVTEYYVNIICDGLAKSGGKVFMTSSIKDICKEDIVVTIEDKDFVEIWLKKHPFKQIHWFQGILPEEAALQFAGHWSQPLRVVFHYLLEKIVLAKSVFNFFVSNAMLKHYQMKYNYQGTSHLIMPCFNTPICEDAFRAERYEHPTFVYAGSMARWQCFDTTVKLFKSIKDKIPEAKLSVYTFQKAQAKAILQKYGLDEKVDSVSSEQMNDVLCKYKYGFLIRENIAVNNVATPTKMNTYMAAGVIPIYTDVIEDYKAIFEPVKYKIALHTSDDVAEQVSHLEQIPISPTEILKDYKAIFRRYWERDKYIAMISDSTSIFSKKQQ